MKFLYKFTLFTAGLSLILWLSTPYFHSKTPKANLTESPYLNVYNWYGMIPESVLKQFEAETGIHIRYDLYDNNEILEAKLLAGRSGYDIVFPSASPYIKREIDAGAFQKLDKSKLTNLKHLDPIFIEHMQPIDPEINYSVPYYWGTFGIAYVEEIIHAKMPNAPLDSYRMLFDPDVVSKFQFCGVSLLDEAVDVYPAILAYLGLDPQSSDLNDLRQAQQHLLKIRPYISRFLGQRFASEIVTGEVCLCQAWSSDVQLAQELAKETQRNITIKYYVPKEGGSLWIDAMCIPRDAPHPNNAHLFINYLLRPDISAKITNIIAYPTTNKSAKGLIDKVMLQNEILYPPKETLDRLKLDKIQNSEYEEVRTRNWFLVKQGA